MLRLSISYVCPEVMCVLCPARILSDGFSCVLRLGTNFKMFVVSMLVFLFTSFVVYVQKKFMNSMGSI